MSDSIDSTGSIEVRIISRRRLTHLKAISEGSFGTVFKGQLRSGPRNQGPQTTVAVKVLKDSSHHDVWSEADRMKKFDHRNILQLIGVSTSPDDLPWLVTEYMKYGDLLTFIRNNAANGKSMDATSMVRYAYGIACGMAYLHHEVVPYEIHCDLSARNCLIGPDYKIKIGDFGKFPSENEIYYYGSYGKLCPLRWMPPENIPISNARNQPKFSRKGDVWAYGVVLFEIWSRGKVPYGNLSDQKVLTALKAQKNPGDYFTVTPRIYVKELMEKCWAFRPELRPNFKYIKNEFKEKDEDVRFFGED